MKELWVTLYNDNLSDTCQAVYGPAHGTEQSAVDAARRLAKSRPGSAFFVAKLTVRIAYDQASESRYGE